MEDIKITTNGDNIYCVDTIGHKCIGFFRRINDKTIETRLDSWFDKNTKRYKGRTNKLYNHMEKWFVYMIEEYYDKKESE